MATVVPWKTPLISAGEISAAARISSTPSMNPVEGSSEVVRTLSK